MVSHSGLKIQRAADTNTRFLWRNHLLLLISSLAGQRCPRQEATGFGSQSHARKLSDPCGNRWPTSEQRSEPLRVFHLQNHQGFPPAAAICAWPKKRLQNSTIKRKESLRNAGSLNKQCARQNSSTFDVKGLGSLVFKLFSVSVRRFLNFNVKPLFLCVKNWTPKKRLFVKPHWI